MKYNYTDTELQAAIDEACKEVAYGPHRPMCAELALLDSEMHAWFNENDARLDLIKFALAALPEPPTVDGMPLRDWFAGQALAGIVQAVAAASLHNSAQTPDDEATARWALGLADAMLKAREVKP